mmetsp:Transcript_10146/g.22847  ORF Transcript_10146/g.22847 Transcript_10146/m.22847 type:complete len:120 (+) Transcript_10146:87-446(+)
MAAEADILAEAEAALDGLEGDPDLADEPNPADEDLGGAEDLVGECEGEDLGCGAPAAGDASQEPQFTVGLNLKLLQGDGTSRECTIVAADKTDMGPMYAVKFENGQVQSLVPEDQLQLL